MDFANIEIGPEIEERRLDETVLSSAGRLFTVMTYNIHHGKGRDGRIDLDRICAVIQEGKPDFVSLQEVDRGMTRSKWIDQGERIADLLQMHHAAGHNWFLEEGACGNVFLSRWPVTLFGNLDLSVPGREPRGCLLVEVHHGGSMLLAASLHFGLGRVERKKQCLTVLDQLKTLYPDDPILVMGDFNTFSFSQVSRQFRKAYVDAFKEAGKGPKSTFRKGGVSMRLDYIYSTAHLLPLNAFVLRTKTSYQASDHFPLVARFLWKREDERREDFKTGQELLSDFSSRSG
jgi:endonuclease/exonuclease/phosphatase family metal-dependent hydrolase